MGTSVATLLFCFVLLADSATLYRNKSVYSTNSGMIAQKSEEISLFTIQVLELSPIKESLRTRVSLLALNGK